MSETEPRIYDSVIKNGTMVTARDVFSADIAIQNQTIAAIGQNLHGHTIIDASDKYVIPGGVDIHVHMQMPLGDGVISADNFHTGTRAAAHGGTTSIIDFVAASPYETLLQALEKRRAEADPAVVIDYGLHMTITPSDIDKLDQLPAVVEAGCSTFKLYMAYGFRLTDDQLYRALTAIKAVGGMTVIHCENWDIIGRLQQDAVAQAHTHARWHPRTRPAIFEAEATQRAIAIAEYVGTPLHIFHVSCREVVDAIQSARQRGLPITGETCPQYLFKTSAAFEADGIASTFPVCAPPIREQAQQNALWQALADGDLQVVSTDHCPFSRADKARGLHDFTQIPGGVPSIEMRLAALHSRGVLGGRLTLSQWVDVCCTTPANLMGLTQKGDIAVGLDADLVVFDPHKTSVISTATLHENVDWTLYDGLPITGWPSVVLSRGRIVVHDDETNFAAGFGRFLN